MARALTEDHEFRTTTYVVIDFETTTPPGRRPEPVDVAAIWLQAGTGRLVETRRFSALMQPPDHAQLTPFDTEQTGITRQMLAGQPPAGVVLARLDAELIDAPHLLVAHNAPTEAGILYDYRQQCPRLAATDFLDTVRLARAVVPELGSHRLDVLIHHLAIPRPPDRHRALPDASVTVAVLQRLLDLADRAQRWSTLGEARRTLGYPAKAAPPAQSALFQV